MKSTLAAAQKLARVLLGAGYQSLDTLIRSDAVWLGELLQDKSVDARQYEAHPNCIAPRKRPLHTIIPGLVYEAGRPSLVFGVMGGHYQSMGHAYYLTRLLADGLDDP